jgi:hypothetical protein
LSTKVGNAGEELDRRHRAASLVVFGGVALTLALMAIAFSGALAGKLGPDPTVTGALLIVVVFLGVGAVVLRRTRMNPMRLSDVAALRGPAGLLQSLEKTSLYVSLIGYAVSLIGFVGSMLTPQPDASRSLMLRLGVIALAVFLYAYPRRAAWRRLVEATPETPAGA